MCQFKSAIVVKEPRNKGGFQLLMSPWTESHSELITIHKLKDDARLKFARVEFTPPSLDQAYLPDVYKLRIDEVRKPEWFTEEMQAQVTNKMRAYIKSIIVSSDVQLLIGGQFIIAPGAKVECAHSMVINAMCGGTLTAMCGGNLTAMCGGTLTAMWGGTLTEMCGGTLTAMRGGNLTAMRGGNLTAMCGGTLTEMCGGTLTEMRGGTLTEIEKGFDGLIGKIGANAKIIADERSK